MRALRRLLCSVVAACVLATLSALIPSQPAAAQGYTPCEDVENIDVVIMMDASGSMNSPRSGVDPSGSIRVSELTSLRPSLAALLDDLDADADISIRLALWRFESDVLEIAPFDTPSESHPSDTDIRRSLGDVLPNGRLSYSVNHTNYIAALDAALSAFDASSRPDACKLLLFFTDGLHDPIGDMTELQAAQLRNEVCNRIKPAYERAGIDTYAILLGTPPVDDPIEAEMWTATKQVLRALTGDSESRLVRLVPHSSALQCQQWSDEQPADRDGAIVSIGGLDDPGGLSSELLKAVDVAANSLVEWVDCGASAGVDSVSGLMPAGMYVDKIVAYPRGANSITGYETIQSDGTTLKEPHSGTGPLRLSPEVFEDYSAGWTVEFQTEAEGNLGVQCFIHHASVERAQSTGAVLSPEGTEITAVERSLNGPDSDPLSIEVTADAPLGLCETEPFDWPDQRVLDWYCTDDGSVVFVLDPLDCQETMRMDPLVAFFEPLHAGSVYGPGEFLVEARILLDAPGSVLHDCFGGPAFECPPEMSAEVVPDQGTLPREPIKAITDCRLHAPQKGTVYLTSTWRPDPDAPELPHDLMWRFDPEFHSGGANGQLSDDGTVLHLSSEHRSESGLQIKFTTPDELQNGDWDIAGTMHLSPSWDPGGGLVPDDVVRTTSDMAHEVGIYAEYQARSDSAAARWITLFLILASLILSYILICLALVNSMTLPDPGKFWMRHAAVPVTADPRGRSVLSGNARQNIQEAHASTIRGTRSRRNKGKRFVRWQSEGLTIRLRRSMWLWLPGLIKHGAWATAETASRHDITSRPLPRRKRRTRKGRALIAADFSKMEAAAHEGPTTAAVWVVLPRTGRDSDPSRIDPRHIEDLLVDSDRSTSRSRTPPVDQGPFDAPAPQSHDRPPPRPS